MWQGHTRLQLMPEVSPSRASQGNADFSTSTAFFEITNGLGKAPVRPVGVSHQPSTIA